MRMQIVRTQNFCKQVNQSVPQLPVMSREKLHPNASNRSIYHLAPDLPEGENQAVQSNKPDPQNYGRSLVLPYDKFNVFRIVPRSC
jgi:hypothetical protein